jgi:hypothetical protein
MGLAVPEGTNVRKTAAATGVGGREQDLIQTRGQFANIWIATNSRVQSRGVFEKLWGYLKIIGSRLIIASQVRGLLYGKHKALSANVLGER